MTVIKLPIKRLADLESQIETLKQQVADLNDRRNAYEYFLIELLLVLSPEQRTEIVLGLEQELLALQNVPEHANEGFVLSSAGLDSLKEFADILGRSLLSSDE
jgi:hypothetical protein